MLAMLNCTRKALLTATRLTISALTVYSIGPVEKAAANADLPAEVSLTPKATAAPLPLNLKGVNLAGGENDYTYPGIAPGTHLEQFPSPGSLAYFYSKGLRTIRIPFQPNDVMPGGVQGKLLNSSVVSQITAIVEQARALGMYVILDPHAYGYMPTGGVSASQSYSLILAGQPAGAAFVEMWARLATKYRNYPNVIYGLMNEPKDQTPQQWHDAAVAAVSGIRTITKTQAITIPGTYYTGAHSWVTSGNAAVWTGFKDTGPSLFEMHEYMDSDFSGTHATCYNGYSAMAEATNWLRINHFKAFLGEVAYSTDSTCVNNGPAFFAGLTQDADVWLGWTWWAAGPEFGSSYMFNLNPNANGSDQPQVETLTANLANTF